MEATSTYIDVMAECEILADEILDFPQTVNADILAVSEKLWLFLPGWNKDHGTICFSLLSRKGIF